jgi:hypothetical protein
MSPSSFRPSRMLLAVLLGSLLAPATVLRAGEGGFAATLSAEQQSAAGLAALSPVERVVLDQLVAGELSTLRRGDGTEPEGSFVSRRTEPERKSAGLDRLNEAQLEKLNEYVASVLAARPKPKERPRLKEADILAARERPQIHGSVTVGYGWGGRGRDMWAESLWLDYYDPDGRFAIGIGLSNANGRGFYGNYPDYYGYGGRYYYDAMPVYATAPVFPDAAYRGARGDFNFGEGLSFCGGRGDYSFGRRGH